MIVLAGSDSSAVAAAAAAAGSSSGKSRGISSQLEGSSLVSWPLSWQPVRSYPVISNHSVISNHFDEGMCQVGDIANNMLNIINLFQINNSQNCDKVSRKVGCENQIMKASKATRINQLRREML